MLNRLAKIIRSVTQSDTLPDGPVFKSRAEHRLIQYRLTVQRMPRRVECPVCGEPADGLDDEHCQKHWEALCSDAWWLAMSKYCAAGFSFDDDLEPIEPGAFHTETDLFDMPGGDDDAD
jgi:hypothetical protein